MGLKDFNEEVCACRSLAEVGDFDGELFTAHDSRCAARLRPLLERCLADMERRKDEFNWDLVADLRREMGKEE